jgi:hypothetical protein
VAFSKSISTRGFSASLDKTFRVYDLIAKCTLKAIQAPSPINKMAVDTTESHVYLACDNQNVYSYSLEANGNTSLGSSEKQKRTL